MTISKYTFIKEVMNMPAKEIYCALTKAANRHRKFSHYTTLPSLEMILKNRSFRLSRLDCVNDLYENEYLDDFCRNKVYVGCFTHRIWESYMYWVIYAKMDITGIMLTFSRELLHENEIFGDSQCQESPLKEVKTTDTLHEGYSCVSDWGVFNVSWADIKYVRDFQMYEETNPMWEHLKGCVNLSKEGFRTAISPGLLKGKEWDVENETRVRVAIRPKDFENNKYGVIRPKFEHLYLKLNEKTWDTCVITLNPWAEKSFYYSVHKLLDQNGLTQVQIYKSSLEGSVRQLRKIEQSCR